MDRTRHGSRRSLASSSLSRLLLCYVALQLFDTAPASRCCAMSDALTRSSFTGVARPQAAASLSACAWPGLPEVEQNRVFDQLQRS